MVPLKWLALYSNPTTFSLLRHLQWMVRSRRVAVFEPQAQKTSSSPDILSEGEEILELNRSAANESPGARLAVRDARNDSAIAPQTLVNDDFSPPPTRR